MVAVGAFSHEFGVFVVPPNGSIGACFDACFASGAFFVVDEYHAFVGNVGRTRRTCFFAQGICAVVAEFWKIGAQDIGVCTRIPAFDPRVEFCHRHIVFLLTSDNAGVASDASRKVDEHTEAPIAGFWHCVSPLSFRDFVDAA